ncbi:hypothetical protein RBA71_07145 [Brenneria goodwinii]|uniref:hypothetical protein n=1 Tax=Brenneria goodwinii TaxID=1109412 RepID=UPI0011AB3E71|nr:hypothetical protein [Brenneria goodwinii]
MAIFAHEIFSAVEYGSFWKFPLPASSADQTGLSIALGNPPPALKPNIRFMYGYCSKWRQIGGDLHQMCFLLPDRRVNSPVIRKVGGKINVGMEMASV